MYTYSIRVQQVSGSETELGIQFKKGKYGEH